MKFALKNSFVAVVIACAMTTQLNAMLLPGNQDLQGVNQELNNSLRNLGGKPNETPGFVTPN